MLPEQELNNLRECNKSLLAKVELMSLHQVYNADVLREHAREDLAERIALHLVKTFSPQLDLSQVQTVINVILDYI